MTITLEKIQEMNIPVGTPIEIIYDENKTKEIYFQGTGSGEVFDNMGDMIFYTNKKTEEANINILFAKGMFINTSNIESIKEDYQ